MGDSKKAAYEREEDEKNLLDRQLRIDKDKAALNAMELTVRRLLASHPDDIYSGLIIMRDYLMGHYPQPYQEHLRVLQRTYPVDKWHPNGHSTRLESDRNFNLNMGSVEFRFRKK